MSNDFCPREQKVTFFLYEDILPTSILIESVFCYFNKEKSANYILFLRSTNRKKHYNKVKKA